MKLEYLILIILTIGFYETSIKEYLKDKKNRDFILNNLELGSKIVTNKGIIGEVVEINNGDVVIISGSKENHSYMKVMIKEITNIIN